MSILVHLSKHKNTHLLNCSAFHSSVQIDRSVVQNVEESIESDGHGIVLQITRQEAITEMLPAFVFIHGDGWIMGEFATHKRLDPDPVIIHT